MDIRERPQIVVMGLVYRPPNATNEINSSLCKKLTEQPGRLQSGICYGCFNNRNVHWNLMVEIHEAEEFLKIIQDKFLKEIIVKLTRENNILDLMLTNREKAVSQVNVRR